MQGQEGVISRRHLTPNHVKYSSLLLWLSCEAVNGLSADLAHASPGHSLTFMQVVPFGLVIHHVVEKIA